MELGLSLGDSPAAAAKPFERAAAAARRASVGLELGFSLGFGRREEEEEEEQEEEEERDERSSGGPPVQLNLLPLAPVPRYPSSSSSSRLGFPWATENRGNYLESSTRNLDVNRMPMAEEVEEGTAAASGSPNSTVSSFPMDFSTTACDGVPGAAAAAGGRSEGEGERGASSRGSDEEDINGTARKKLRLSKEQSAFLEESFKEHNTLNPKQKIALAKQLNLRPRQVEVWFQNRRARTKLKQTEVDCEYLKRCCETLTEENRRLQKELSELRALKTPSHPFYMQLPATTLSMCPSCERTTTTTSTAAATSASPSAAAGSSGSNHKPSTTNSFASLFAKPRFYPFAPHTSPSPAS